jgi:hypothetical protein
MYTNVSTLDIIYYLIIIVFIDIFKNYISSAICEKMQSNIV